MKKEKVIPFDFGRINAPQVLRYLVFASAATALLIYAWVVCMRITYPFELEWIEGGVLEQVRRIVNGQAVYVAPGMDFIPFIYPPLYFQISAIFTKVLDDGFFPLRLVSVIASVISFVMILLIVHRETGDGWAACLSAGVMAASFRVTGAWLDIARVDSLFLALLLVIVYLIRGRLSLWRAILTGVFSGLAFLTKQTAIMVCLPIFACLLWSHWRYALLSLAAALLVAGGTSLVMDLHSGGWYSYYVFDSLSQQAQWLPLEFVTFWKNDLFLHLPIAILFTLFAFLERSRSDRTFLVCWLAVLAGALGASFLSRVKIGGYDNVLLPAFAAIAILFGLGVSAALRSLKQEEVHKRKRMEIILLVACLLQMMILFYNPFTQIPTRADRQEGERLVAWLAESDQSIYMPDHGYLLTLAGRETQAHHAAIWDVMRTGQSNPVKDLLGAALAEAIRQQRYDVIILDAGGNFCCPEIDVYYTRVGEVFHDEDVFFPVTGDRRRPTYIYEAKRLR